MIARFTQRYGRPAGTHRYIPQLDGLRLLAIALVVIWHVSLRAARRIDDINNGNRIELLTTGVAGGRLPGWYMYFPHGEVGVGLFFLISGFIIAQPFRSTPWRHWNIGNFYWRRVHRIAPPYWIMLLIAAALVFSSGFTRKHGSEAGLESLTVSLLYLHSLVYDSASPFDPPMWSLEIETQFYLLAPLLFFLFFYFKSQAKRMLVFAVGLAATIALSWQAYAVLAYDGRFRFGLLEHAYLFIGGVLLADLRVESRPASHSLARFGDVMFVGGVAAMIVLGLYYTQCNARPPAGLPHLITQLVLLLSSGAIFCGGLNGHVAGSILSRPLITTLGAMCYAIYLVHVIVVEMAARLVLNHVPLHSVPAVYTVYFATLTPLAFAAGVPFYIWFERPFMNRRLRPSMSAEKGAVRAAP